MKARLYVPLSIILVITLLLPAGIPPPAVAQSHPRGTLSAAQNAPQRFASTTQPDAAEER